MGPYDEFIAEMNGNALVIRVLKDEKKVTRVFEEEDSDDESCCCKKKSQKTALTYNPVDNVKFSL